jgi:hypothetical protein
MKEWVDAWEMTFNLGDGEEMYRSEMQGVLDTSHRSSFALDDLLRCSRGGELKGEPRDYVRELVPEFRRKYYVNASPRMADEVIFSVHVRRGNVSSQEFNYMYTDTQKILQTAASVKSILESRGIKFCIRVFSQGEMKDFSKLLPLGARFFLDTDPIWTIRELVEADILIVANSSFSYYAGIISDGIKIFEPDSRKWRWPDVAGWDDWIACEEDGSFDRAAFEQKLLKVLFRQNRAI